MDHVLATSSLDHAQFCSMLAQTGLSSEDPDETRKRVKEHLHRQVVSLLEAVHQGIETHSFKLCKKPSSILASGDGM